MRTKEIPTGIINTIKKNDKLAEQLEKMENIINEIYDPITNKNQYDYHKLNYYPILGKNDSPNDKETFWYNLLRFMEEGQRVLTDDSKNLINKYK